MEKSNGKSTEAKYQPICMLAHDLVNRLSIIVGHCDLIEEEQQDASRRSDSVRTIRDVAKSAAIELADHLCHLDSLAQIRAAQPSSPSKAASSASG